MHITILSTNNEDAQIISELALRSKAYWGYSADFMKAVHVEFNYSHSDINQHTTFSAWHQHQLVGFYQLIETSSTNTELDALFVDPEYIGSGIGVQLFDHAASTAQKLKYLTMSLLSDPFAEGFYLKLGCIKVGEKPSLSIPGRMLPLMTYDLT